MGRKELKIKLIRKLFWLGVVLMISSSCTRDDGDSKDKSKISIALPQTLAPLQQKAGAFSAGSQLIYASISISGAGMTTISYQWESCRDCANPPPPPIEFQFEVSGGTGRLFQLLAAYESASTGNVSLYYGETLRDLVGGELDVPINISQIQQGPFVQGRIAGRYLDGPDTGPSGLVDVFYYPPSGRPKMKFETTSITAGWFNFFMISGANFEFVLRSTGEVLWGQPVNLESAVFDPMADGAVMRAYYPVHVRRDSAPPPTYFEYYLSSAKILTWGFWNKPGSSGNASTKYVCRNGIPLNLDKTRVYDASNPSSTLALTVSYSYAGTPPSSLLADTVTPHGTVYILGGQAYDVGMYRCGPHDISSKYDKFLMAENYNVDGAGNDNYAGFQKVFQANSYGGSITENSSSATTSRDFEYKLLPGVGSVVTHMKVYTKTGFGPDDRLENPQCSGLASEGWTPHTVSTTSTIFSTLLSSTANILASGTAAIVCPMTSAATYLGWGGGQFVASRDIRIPSSLSVTSSGMFNVNQCLTIIVDLKDSNNNILNVGATTPFNFISSGVAGNFYPDPSCMSGGASTFTYALNSGNGIFYGYFKPTASGAMSVQINGSPMGIGVSGSLNQNINP